MITTTEQKGDIIPGSRFLRDFCEECGEPIRVVRIGLPEYCTMCRPAGEPAKLPGARLVGDKLHLGKPKK